MYNQNKFIQYKGYDIEVQEEGNLTEGAAGCYCFTIACSEVYASYIEDVKQIIDAEESSGTGLDVWDQIYGEYI